MAKSKPYKVFISHSVKDKWIAVQLDRLIVQTRIATFRDDRDIEGGAGIAESIRLEMSRCNEMLVLWTPQAINSAWVMQEVGMAYGLGLHIVPIRYLTDVTTLPPLIRDVHAPELTEADIMKYLRQLGQRSRKRS
jgi:hypothetical protein